MIPDDNAAPGEQSAAAEGSAGTAEGSAGTAEGSAGTWADVQAREQQFRRDFGRAPVGLVMASLRGSGCCVCLAVNETYSELTGYSPAELSGSDLLGYFHPEDQPALEMLITDATSGAVDQIGADARLVRIDGELVWIRLTGSVIRPSAGEPYLAVFAEDVTAARQAQAEIQRLQRELQRSRRLASLGQLVGGIGHDFSNTLTVIANYASLVHDEVTVAETTESVAKWRRVRWDVEQIEEAAERSKRLIKHLLAFTRREEAEPVLLDLGQAISDANGLLAEVLGEHVPIVTRQATGLWPVQADPGLLKQAIINIALNARDAMPGGGQVTIDAMNLDLDHLPADWRDVTDLAELLPGRYVAFRLADTGAGMDAATAQRAFEPFFTTKNGDLAAGLGLPAVHRFAAQVGGKAWLRSELGIGTTVTVVLPATIGSVTPAAASRPPASGLLSTVLVVDDEAAIREVAHRVLTSAGYQVETAATGHEALGLLANPGFGADLILTDVVMPGMTGAAFATQARALRPGLPVLFMSGYEPAATAEGWPEPGAQIIGKPFSRAALLARVNHMLMAGVHAGAGKLPEQRSLSEQPQPAYYRTQTERW